MVSAGAHAQTSVAHRDSSVFVAIVRSLDGYEAFQRGGGVQVDPQPLTDSTEWSGWAGGAGGLAAAWSPRPGTGRTASTSEVTNARRSMLRDLGVRIGDAKRPEGCGGIMIPYSPSDEAHRRCPKDVRVVASIGVPRDTTESGSTSRQLTTTRVAVLEVGPTGFSLVYLDYTLEATAAGWKLVHSRVVGFVE
jgi:hypothetical protein